MQVNNLNQIINAQNLLPSKHSKNPLYVSLPFFSPKIKSFNEFLKMKKAFQKRTIVKTVFKDIKRKIPFD